MVLNTAIGTNNSDVVVFDRDLIALRRARAKAAFANHDFLFLWGKEQLSERLLDINRDFPNVLQIGSRGGFIKNEHPKLSKNIVTFDLCPAPIDDVTCPDVYHYIQGDEEFLPIVPKTMDLVISNLNLHSTNDLPGTLLQIRKTLKDDGMFLATMLGGETLYELREAMAVTEQDLLGETSAHIFPFADKTQMGGLLFRAGLALPVIDSDIITVTYENVFKLMTDLRGMGESNTILKRSKKPLTKEFFIRLAQNYRERYSDEGGRIKASFEVIFLLGWAPHKSQQKPLPPGSAKLSLAEALGATEIKLGD